LVTEISAVRAAGCGSAAARYRRIAVRRGWSGGNSYPFLMKFSLFFLGL
jgi:hypothetical protein